MRSNLQPSRDFANKGSESGADIERDDVGQILVRVEARFDVTILLPSTTVEAPRHMQSSTTSLAFRQLLATAGFNVAVLPMGVLPSS